MSWELEAYEALERHRREEILAILKEVGLYSYPPERPEESEDQQDERNQ